MPDKRYRPFELISGYPTHMSRQNLKKLAVGIVVFGLLVLGLRLLRVFFLNAFLPAYDYKAARNQFFAAALFTLCQIMGGALLRFNFRKAIPEIDQHVDWLDRCFSILRWSLLFLGTSAVTVVLILLFERRRYL